jgi:four helix bundle protein
MRRAVVSIPSNIAEGAARNSQREFAQFLNVAGGSLSELDTQIEIAGNLQYLSEEEKTEVGHQIDAVAIKLAGLMNHIKGKINSDK